jgi:hypothetical protein
MALTRCLGFEDQDPTFVANTSTPVFDAGVTPLGYGHSLSRNAGGTVGTHSWVSVGRDFSTTDRFMMGWHGRFTGTSSLTDGGTRSIYLAAAAISGPTSGCRLTYASNSTAESGLFVVQALAGSNTVHLVGDSPLAFNTWYWFTFMNDPVNTTMRLWVHGVLWGETTSFAYTSTGISLAALGATSSASGQFYYDDVVFWDATGTGPLSDDEEFAGEMRVLGLVPTSDGTTTNWSRFSTGAGNHYSLIDESPPNSTDYIYATSTDTLNLLGYSTIAVGYQVYAAQLTPHWRRADAGLIYAQGVSYDGANYGYSTAQLTPGTTFKGLGSFPLQRAPDASTWTSTKLNAAQFGLITRGT